MDDLLLAAADTPALVLDPASDRIVAASPAACALLGFGRAELLATSISALHPGELEQLQGLVERALRDGHGSTVILTCRTRSGVRLPVELTLVPFEERGRALLLALVEDRSEHR